MANYEDNCIKSYIDGMLGLIENLREGNQLIVDDQTLVIWRRVLIRIKKNMEDHGTIFISATIIE